MSNEEEQFEKAMIDYEAWQKERAMWALKGGGDFGPGDPVPFWLRWYMWAKIFICLKMNWITGYDMDLESWIGYDYSSTDSCQSWREVRASTRITSWKISIGQDSN